MSLLNILFRKARPKEHWEGVYGSKPPEDVTWFQSRPAMSLDFLALAGAAPGDRIIDIGGGASNLVDHLLSQGFSDLTVLDLSGNALAHARQRLGAGASGVEWIEADITTYQFMESRYDIWHDRAVFHFLTEPGQRRAYVDALGKALRPGGHLVMATFGLRGPRKCSGLPVVRYSLETLGAELGGGFTPLRSEDETHVAPTGHRQHFTWCLFRKEG